MLKRFVATFIRLLLRLRYQVEIVGLEQLQAKREGGMLVLPNHPALIDPVILAAFLWPMMPLRPVVLEKYYYLSGVHWLLNWIGSIPMPDMESDVGPYKQRRVHRAMDAIGNALHKGDNVLFYPSGRLMFKGIEKLAGSSGAYQLLQDFPDANVLLIRTKGLFGSSFSKAFTGKSPSFFSTLYQGLKTILRNFVFFVPKRKVTVELSLNPSTLSRTSDVVSFNRSLEQWFNSPGREEPVLVSRSFWRKDVPKLLETKAEEEESVEVPAEVLTKVKNKLAELSGKVADEIALEHRLGDDLGLDSLSTAEVLFWLDQEFGVTDVHVIELLTVAAVARAAAGGTASCGTEEEVELTPVDWNETPGRPQISLDSFNTIPETFFHKAEQFAGWNAVADERVGVLTWDKVKLAVLVLASEIKKLPGKNVGVMLPASVASGLVTMSVMVAGKTPVMVNWTSGRRNLEQALNIAQLQVIITAEAFLDQIEADVSFLEPYFCFLEQLRRVSLAAKARALVLSKMSARTLCAYFRLNKQESSSPAAILFTSGSEAAPKAVPLTHANILSDILGAMSVIEFQNEDQLLSFLPPFHSYGLTVCTLLPLLIGLRSVYYPNPNESRKIAGVCGKWRTTIVAGTPTFLKSILAAGTKEKLRSMRLMVSGAEQAPQTLFDAADALGTGVLVIEGYGITECAPIVTANRAGEARMGVGRPLPGVELLIVDHQTFRPVADGERGLILIHGPNVFSGYLGGKPNPFVEVNGKRWYNSGDLGYLKEGRLVIAGRLKRFVKIAGEMVSLPAIEEVLSEQWPDPEGKPSLAVIEREGSDGGRPLLFLFSALEIRIGEANELLSKKGFPNLVRISDVIKLDQLPLLGTGKVDLQQLIGKLPREKEGGME